MSHDIPTVFIARRDGVVVGHLSERPPKDHPGDGLTWEEVPADHPELVALNKVKVFVGRMGNEVMGVWAHRPTMMDVPPKQRAHDKHLTFEEVADDHPEVVAFLERMKTPLTAAQSLAAKAKVKAAMEAAGRR